MISRHTGVLSYMSPSLNFKEGVEEADRGNDGKTASKSGLDLNGIPYYGKPRAARNGGSWM